MTFCTNEVMKLATPTLESDRNEQYNMIEVVRNEAFENN